MFSTANFDQISRPIAAPVVKNISHQSVNSESLPLHDHLGVFYGNFTFAPLENANHVSFDRYCGPTPESNWVIPGKLLVGAFPASASDEETFDLLTSIMQYGVTKFVCLQREV